MGCQPLLLRCPVPADLEEAVDGSTRDNERGEVRAGDLQEENRFTNSEEHNVSWRALEVAQRR